MGIALPSRGRRGIWCCRIDDRKRIDNVLVCFSRYIGMNEHIIYIECRRISPYGTSSWVQYYHAFVVWTKKLAKHAPQSPCLCELNELTSKTSLSWFSTYLWVFGHLKQSLKDIFVANFGFWWKILWRLYTKYTRDSALAEVHAQFSSGKTPWGPERDEVSSQPLPLR